MSRRSYQGLPVRTGLLTRYLDAMGRTPIEEASLEDIRASREQVYPAWPPFSWITGPTGRGVRISDAHVRARDGHRVPVRCYAPASDRPLPLLVYLHGGGWVWGSTFMYDPLCSRLAAAVPAVVVSVAYRLAPEHRSPQAVLDCLDVVTALVQDRATVVADGVPAYDPDQVGLAGDSAGGNLSAVLAQQLRDLRGPGGEPAVRHQALIYPATDMTLASPSIRENAHAPILTEAAVHAFRAHYLGDAPTEDQLRDPLSSPLFGDLEGVAPALVQVAEKDPIRDDGTRYAAALQAAGVPVRATEYVGLPHGFASFPGACPAGKQAESELAGEIRRHLAP